MELPTKKVMGQIRVEFSHYDLTSEEEDTTLLEDLAEKHGVDYKLLVAAARSENWFAQREMKKAHFRSSLAKATEKELDTAAINIARQQTSFLLESINTVNNKLPQVLEYLDALMLNGQLGDKAAVTYASLLMKIRADLMKQMGEALKEKAPDNPQQLETHKNDDFLNSLPAKAQIIDATRKQEYEVEEFQEE